MDDQYSSGNDVADISAIIECFRTDPGAPFEPGNIELFRMQRRYDAAQFQRTLAIMKAAKVPITDLKKAMDQADSFAAPDKSKGEDTSDFLADVKPWHESVDVKGFG